MKTYTIAAIGRQSGAIGITHPFTEVVVANDPVQAVHRLYMGATESGKAWELISGARVKQQQATSPVTGQGKRNNQRKVTT